MMTLGAKKFDRYLLPAVPALVVLASLGWWLLLERVRQPIGAARPGRSGWRCSARLPLVSTYPYPLSYYNPLLGGGAAAQRTVMIGNGEGLDQAARWLAAQPNAAELRVAAHSWDILAGLVPADGEPLRDGIPDDADYIVTYGRRIQMHRWGPSLERYLAANPPVYTVWINGIEYVHIHPGPHRGQRPVSGASLAETARGRGSLGRPSRSGPGGWLSPWRVAVGRARRSSCWRRPSGSYAIDTYVTIDESRWVQRASDFCGVHRAGQAGGDVHHRPPGRHDDVDGAARDGAGARAALLVPGGPRRRHPPRGVLRGAGRRAAAVRGRRRRSAWRRWRCSAGGCSGRGRASSAGCCWRSSRSWSPTPGSRTSTPA